MTLLYSSHPALPNRGSQNRQRPGPQKGLSFNFQFLIYNFQFSILGFSLVLLVPVLACLRTCPGTASGRCRIHVPVVRKLKIRN
jgi:hypothetical protein